VERLGNSHALGGRRMSETPRFNIIGIVVGGAVLALAAGFLLFGRGQSSSTAATTHTVIPLSQRAHGKKKPAAPAKKPALRKPVKKPATPAPEQSDDSADGLPASLTAALALHRIVVVSLYAPKIDLDQMATAEAQAGAREAGAGFVAINVLSESQSRPLTKQLGVLEDPAVLIFRRPDELALRLSGFADKHTVLQAARNAGL
jgi:hypothetical protein